MNKVTPTNRVLSQLLNGHKKQIKLSRKSNKRGDTSIGKMLRLRAYYRDMSSILSTWEKFLSIRQKHTSDQYLVVDQAILHTSHHQVKSLVQAEPQLRGNHLGILEILSPSYLLNYPISSATNGRTHAGLRAVFQQALPDPFDRVSILSQQVESFLDTAVQKGTLHAENDLPNLMLKVMHQLVFRFSPLKEEISNSRAYLKGLPLAALPNWVSRHLLWFKTRRSIRHRKRMTRLYQSAINWPDYLAIAADYGLSADCVANGLFDMIHIAGTAVTSPLLGSVIGVLCSNETADTQLSTVNTAVIDSETKKKAIAEINTIWENRTQLDTQALQQATVLHRIILETARLYPPVRFVNQLAQSEGTIEISSPNKINSSHTEQSKTTPSKCPFHQGTRLLGAIFTANRDKDRYQNPDSFSIDRDFSDLLSWNGHNHERACPGMSLSIELTKIFCLHLFKHYQWESPEKVEWDFNKPTALTPNSLVLKNFSQKAHPAAHLPTEALHAHA